MSRITANYDKICFGIWLRGSRALKSAQEFISAASEPHLSKQSGARWGCRYALCTCSRACARVRG